MIAVFDEAAYMEALRSGFDALEEKHETLEADAFARFEANLYKTIGKVYGVDPRKVREDMEDFDWMLEEE